VIQQLREVFPDLPAHQYLIFDNDSIFSPEVIRTISSFGMNPQRTALRSPWQNGTAERFVGSVRRELVDHVVVLGETHLRRLLREYVEYYNSDRVHTSIGDAPEGRGAKVVGSSGGRPPPPLRVGRGCLRTGFVLHNQAEGARG
jgi:putative transposase